MGKLPVVCILTLTDKLTHRIHRAQTLGWLSLLLILHLSLGLCLHLVPLIGQSEGCVGSLDGAGVYLTGSVYAGRCLLPHAHRAGIGKSYCSSAQQRCKRHTELARTAEGSQRGPPIHGQRAHWLLRTKTSPSGSMQGNRSEKPVTKQKDKFWPNQPIQHAVFPLGCSEEIPHLSI